MTRKGSSSYNTTLILQMELIEATQEISSNDYHIRTLSSLVRIKQETQRTFS